MKKVVYICSVLCGITALLTLVMGIRALTGYRYAIGIRMFYLASNGTANGFIGNLLGTVVTCFGFGALALYGFGSSKEAKKNAFIYGLIVTGLCLISMITAFFSRRFSMGDLYITALPAIYTFAVLKSA